MKTFIISARQGIGYDGVKLEPGDEVAICTGNIHPIDLFAMVQFGHATVVEVTEDAEVEQSDDSVHGGEQPAEITPGSLPVSPEDSDQESEQNVESEPEKPDADESNEDKSGAVEQFIDDGLDEKIAEALARQGLEPGELREMIADGYDLEELDEIGKVRAEKILAIYK